MTSLRRIFRDPRFWSVALGLPALLLAFAGLRLLSVESASRRASETEEQAGRTELLGTMFRSSGLGREPEAAAERKEPPLALCGGTGTYVLDSMPAPASAPAPVPASVQAAVSASAPPPVPVPESQSAAPAAAPASAPAAAPAEVARHLSSPELASRSAPAWASRSAPTPRRWSGGEPRGVLAESETSAVGGGVGQYVGFWAEEDSDGAPDGWDASEGFFSDGAVFCEDACVEMCEREVSAEDEGVVLYDYRRVSPAGEDRGLDAFSALCGDVSGPEGVELEEEDEDGDVREDARRLLASLLEGLRGASAGRAGLVACEIRDADGGLVCSEGGPIPDGAGESVSLAPDLPGWTLRAVWAERDGGGAAAAGARRLRAVGGILLLLFATAPLGASVLLWRQARRERREARRKTDFVATVSHELRTPLTSIRLHAELLAAGRVPEGEARDGAFATILSECDRLGRLIGNVLDFGRLERGDRRYAAERLDLAALARETCDAARAGLEARGGGVRFVGADEGGDGPGGEPVGALADRDAVRQILLNLLDNAVKYAAAGGPAEVSARSLADGRAELRVEDRGPGIASGDRERVFEKFFRADDAVTRETGGSGLGLSIARGLARGMGGELECRPRRGGGCAFVLTLPGGGGASGGRAQEEGGTEWRTF